MREEGREGSWKKKTRGRGVVRNGTERREMEGRKRNERERPEGKNSERQKAFWSLLFYFTFCGVFSYLKEEGKNYLREK